jgi:hypothetical protein
MADRKSIASKNNMNEVLKFLTIDAICLVYTAFMLEITNQPSRNARLL